MRDCRRSRAPGCRLARVVSIVLLLQQQAGPFPPCSATESVPEGPLPYFFGSSSTYAAVRATIPNAQTCTVSNPSQNNDPAQERPQVCVPMTDSMLTLAEARAAAKRIRAFKTRGQTGSAANVDGSNRHSISNSSRLDSERLKLQDGVLPVPCNIPIISNLTDSFESFIDKFRHQPVIFSLQEWADAISQWKTRDVSFQGSPWKQFDWTESVLPLSQERQAESVGAKGQGTSTDKSKVAWEMQRVVRCLCNPIHGTLLHESTHISLQQELAPLFRNDGAELPATKYCLWGTSSLLNYLFGVAEGDGGSAPARHIVPEVNGELAKLLKFQCRVTPTCHGNIGVTALRHFSSRVLSLSWWPLAAALPASGIWLSSANTRTALHHDLYTQFLVQVAGEKIVSLLPKVPPACFRHAWLHDGPLVNGSDAQQGLRDDLDSSGCANQSGETYAGPPGLQSSSADICFDDWALHQAPTPPPEEDQFNHPADKIFQCRLRPGQVLWIPPRMPHDIYSATNSLSLSIRFPGTS